MATSFSVLPLRLATYTGFVLAGVSSIMIVLVLAQKLMHPELAAGWTSLMATILFIGGIQTLCIGVMGEYLGRTYLKLNRKPQFVVGSTTWSPQKRNEQA
jgi:polyisoprenyl-phosphate glycosyltransferase